MHSNLKYIFVLFLSLFVFFGFVGKKNDFVRGRIIKVNGDTIHCLLHDIEYDDQSKIWYKKLDNLKVELKLSKDSIKRITIKNKIYDKLSFQSSYSEDGTVVSEFYGLEREGYIRLYYRSQEATTGGSVRHYVPGPNGAGGGGGYWMGGGSASKEDRYVYFLRKGKGGLKQLAGISLKADLKAILGDCPAVIQKMEEEDFKLKTDWKDLVRIYNEWYVKK